MHQQSARGIAMEALPAEPHSCCDESLTQKGALQSQANHQRKFLLRHPATGSKLALAAAAPAVAAPEALAASARNRCCHGEY